MGTELLLSDPFLLIAEKRQDDRGFMHPEFDCWIENCRQYPNQISVESIDSILASLKSSNIERTEGARPISPGTEEQKDAETDLNIVRTEETQAVSSAPNSPAPDEQEMLRMMTQADELSDPEDDDDFESLPMLSDEEAIRSPPESLFEDRQRLVETIQNKSLLPQSRVVDLQDPVPIQGCKSAAQILPTIPQDGTEVNAKNDVP